MQFRLWLAVVVCSTIGSGVMAQNVPNNQETLFTKKNRKEKSTNGYGDKNSSEYFGTTLLTIAPIFVSEDGIGLSFGMERILDRAGIMSYQIPVSIAFNTVADNYSYNEARRSDAMFYLTPGIKFYPTSAYGKERLSVGPSLVIGVGQKTEVDNRTFSPVADRFNTRRKLMLGAMINACLNEQQTKYLYLGADFGLGVTYFNQVGGVNQPLSLIVQLGLKMGFRY